MREKRLKNYLKLSTLLFGVSLFTINCHSDKDEEEYLNEIKPVNVKTVSLEDAKSFFTNNKKSNQSTKGKSDKSNNDFVLDPDWSTLMYHDIYNMKP
ncbi:MAG: hypothetical protein ACON5F_00180 [Jejuia sp.]